MTVLGIARWLACAALFGAVAAARLGAQADGTKRWGFTVQGFVNSSPAIAEDGTIYLGVWIDSTPNRGRLVALNPDSSLKWIFPKTTEAQIDRVESSPAVGPDGTIYFGCGDGKLYALDPGTGTKKWTFDTHAAEIFSSPTIGPDGTIYIISSDLLLHAVAPGGTERWSHVAGSALADSAAVIGDDGTLYLGSSDQNVYALRPDGSERWHLGVGAALISSPAIGPDGTIYIGASDNRLHAITRDGAPKWTFLAGNLIVSAASLAADGTIYFGSLDGYFYALASDGTLKWKVNLHAQIASAAAVRADGTIIFGADDNLVHALTSSGAPKWTFQTGDIVESSPVIAADGSIYIGSFDGKLYSLFGNGAPLSTFSSWPMFNHDALHTGRVRPTTSGGYLINLSTYAQAGGGANLIAGFVVQGAASKRFLIRAVGPALEQFGVPNWLPDPAVALLQAPAGTGISSNDNWSSEGNFGPVASATFSVGTFQLPSGGKDAALAATLAPGSYTAVVGSSDGGTGVALVEAYDTEVNSGAARLVNLSARAQSGSGANVLTAGLVIGGQGTLRVLVRAIGPGLAQFGVSGVLARPSLKVYDSHQRVLESNTGWTSLGLTEDLAAAARLTGAFALSATGAGSADSATVVTLTPGTYTIQVSGVGGTAGEALVEVYGIP